MNDDDLVQLVGLTDNAINAIEEHGDIWFITRKMQGKPFPSANQGTWMLLKPYMDTQVTKSIAKWVCVEQDYNFEVIMK